MLLYFAFASLNVFVAAMQTNKKCAIKLRGFLLLDRWLKLLLHIKKGKQGKVGKEMDLINV